MSRAWPSIVVVLTVLAVWMLGAEVRSGHDPLAAMGLLLEGFLQPDVQLSTLGRVAGLAAQTVAVAVVGTALGAAAGGVLASVAAGSRVSGHDSRWRRGVGVGVRLGFDALRAIPDFAWALALLVVLGPGVWTGTFAIAISVTGILGRAFSQLLEAVPSDAVRTVERGSRGPLVALLYGRWPRVAAAAWSYGLARLECSVRNASVIGIVGGGGLGAELFEELGYGRTDRVATLLLGLVGVTALGDIGSGWLRRRWTQRHRRSTWLAAATLVVLGVGWLLPDAIELGRTLARLDARVAAQSVARMLHPELSVDVLQTVVRGVAVPLSLAWLSTLAAVVVALGALAWTSTAVRRRLRGPAAATGSGRVALALGLRLVALLARAVPEVAWLLLFAAALGMGTLPAVLALGLHASGVLVRLFTEAVDDRFTAAPLRSLAPAVAGPWLLYVALPRLRGPLATHTALQGEANLRTAFTLGILGVGGIGESFHTAISFWQLERASTLAVAMVVLFVVVDRLARGAARSLSPDRASPAGGTARAPRSR